MGMCEYKLMQFNTKLNFNVTLKEQNEMKPQKVL